MFNAIRAVALLTLAASASATEVQPVTQELPQFPLTDVTNYESSRDATRTYVIQLRAEPGISYQGGEGFAATAPADGERYDATAAHVQAYTTHLVDSHDSMLSQMGIGDAKVYSYCHAMNGFAARLTTAQADALRRDPNVMQVFEDYSVDVETSDTPDFLGLNDRPGGLRSTLGLKGEDVVIGVLDTGAVQEHPSFSDRRGGTLPPACDKGPGEPVSAGCQRAIDRINEVVYDAPEDWNGICQAGEGWSEDDCNNKMIGARWYVDGFLAGRGSVVEGEFLSPRDSSGHGSHTASTAGGNVVTAEFDGVPVSEISGMAPRARLAIYKVCWLSPGATNFSCFFSDSAAATDAAVADGVDVLNFSVGTAASFVDAQDLAFLRAVSDGVFVARSAGNDGPGFATTNAGEPWVTSVGASTTDGSLFSLGADVTVNAPASQAGTLEALEGDITRSLSETGPVSGAVGAADPILACDPLSSDLTGQIALIARGTCAFTTKVENAVNAGAVAVLVYTDDRDKTVMGGTATPLTESVPGVMIDNAPGVALFGELTAGGSVDVTIAGGRVITSDRTGNIMAGFSSRGPYLTEANWLKPDITAPGVQILAATTPDLASGAEGDLYGYLSGTSMSGPHIAGLGALVKEAHPDWSPAQIKSALMTTARQNVFKEDGETPADPFDFGSGHVDPNKAVAPGLTYDAGLLDYLAASCGTVTPLLSDADCAAFDADPSVSTDPAELNLPSIGLNGIIGAKTVTRTVTAVNRYSRGRAPTPRKVTYTAEVEAPPGYEVSVNPSQITLYPGESATYEVTVANDSAAPNTWQFGALTWKTRKGNDVRSPIAVNALAFDTAEEVTGEGPEGTAQFDLLFGYTGEYTAQVHGLNEPTLSLPPALVDDPDNSFALLVQRSEHLCV